MTTTQNSNSGKLNTIVIIGTIIALIVNCINLSLYVTKGISSISYMTKFIIEIIFVAITSGFAIYLFYCAYKKERNDKLTRLLKKRIVIPFSILFVLNIIIATYMYGYSNEKSSIVRQTNNRTRIVLLLPLNENLGAASDDGLRQLYGYADFLKDNPNATQQFDFIIYDHGLNIENAKKIIQNEISEGTKYFVCTMSSITLPLSQEFKELSKKYNTCKTKSPKLICAITSAPHVKLEKGSVYRFYIRSQEEAALLATIGDKESINSATFIVVADDYGIGAVAEFKKNWKNKILQEGLYLDKTLKEEEIQNLIEEKIKIIPPSQRQAIFICHYGEGIDNIITALDKLSIKATILATSTMSIPSWQRPIKNILNNMDWYTCVPDYSTSKPNQNDVVRNFMTYVLNRLTYVISKDSIENDSNKFDELWHDINNSSPNNLEIKWDTLDAKIPMKLVDKNEYKDLYQNK